MSGESMSNETRTEFDMLIAEFHRIKLPSATQRIYDANNELRKECADLMRVNDSHWRTEKRYEERIRELESDVVYEDIAALKRIIDLQGGVFGQCGEIQIACEMPPKCDGIMERLRMKTNILLKQILNDHKGV